VRGVTSGEIHDYQASAWLMAALLRGLCRAETAALTDAMLHSGEVLDLSDFPAAKVDKHSTGGVGDKTSLVVAPAAAAAGLVVPMISGRGLAHTGGTLDKLEAIPGFQTGLSLARFREVLRSCGCAIIVATEEIAPADKKFYALRDVTGTVDSPALMCASIMSKKAAEGIDALVLDVKTGSGAFMKTEQEAVSLAELMVETGERIGIKTTALITSMDQPLGHRIGNAVEVEEALEVLRGQGPEDLQELCRELTAWMLQTAGRTRELAEAKQLYEEVIRSGAAFKKFREMVVLQGGDPAAVDRPVLLPRAKFSVEVPSPRSGFVYAIQCEAVGRACTLLGGGREKKEDLVEPAAGILLHKKVGDGVSAGESVCTILYNDAMRAAHAVKLLQESYRIGDELPPAIKLVRRVISKA
jgi:pyrimidine-nucleoside phosphorylase